jgi:hypothetical protein
MTNTYFGGLRESKNVQAGRAFLTNNYDKLLLRDKNGLVDLPNREDWRNVMWAGESLLCSSDVSRKCKEEALRFLRAVMDRLGVEESAHA